MQIIVCFAPYDAKDHTDYAKISGLLYAQKFNSGQNLLKLLYHGYADILVKSLNHGRRFHLPL